MTIPDYNESRLRLRLFLNDAYSRGIKELLSSLQYLFSKCCDISMNLPLLFWFGLVFGVFVCFILFCLLVHSKHFLGNFKSHKGAPTFSFLPCSTPWQHGGTGETLNLMCIRGVHLSNPGLFNFAVNSVKLAFTPAWLNPQEPGELWSQLTSGRSSPARLGQPLPSCP